MRGVLFYRSAGCVSPGYLGLLCRANLEHPNEQRLHDMSPKLTYQEPFPSDNTRECQLHVCAPQQVSLHRLQPVEKLEPMQIKSRNKRLP